MKMIDLAETKLDVIGLLTLARLEPVMLITADGHEFFLAEADDFEQEVAALRSSQAFQRFLDRRSANQRRIPLEDIEREIEQELAAQQPG